ncbi:MAG: hypothetical protein KKG94_00885 [Nanoarchaeota archaeon]|nr:hypothetical protein [Nanoarchaeota archaeon]
MVRIKNRFACDADGVLTDTGSAFAKILSKINNRSVSQSEITEYSMANLGLPDSELKNYLNNQFYMNLSPIKNSVKLINELFQDNYIPIITARDQYDGVMQDTETWFFDNGVLFDDLIQERDKSIPIKELGLDFIVEDCYETCLDLAKKGIKTILFKQPWNKKYKLGTEEDKGLIKSVEDWHEIHYTINNGIDKFWD